MLTWDAINQWFDKFYDNVVEGRKVVRGRSFTGAKIEIYGHNDIAIVLENPRVRGNTEDEKVEDFVRSYETDCVTLTAELNLDRFEKLVGGQIELVDSDWVWNDE